MLGLEGGEPVSDCVKRGRRAKPQTEYRFGVFVFPLVILVDYVLCSVSLF